VIVLLDANNLAARSFHAAKHMMTSADGQETGSLQIFAASLSRYLGDLRPTHFVACWDAPGPNFRHDIYPDYKLARKSLDVDPSVPAYSLVQQFLQLVGLAQWRQPGVEADDLIAAAWRRTRALDAPSAPIAILSSDKDLLQLLDDHTQQLRFSSHNTPSDVWTRQRVVRDMGYEPEQMPLVMAFTGDRVDGVPGARGIGPVKALKLLRECGWDFELATSRCQDADAEMVKTSRQLVDLRTIDRFPVPPVPKYEPLGRFSPDAAARLDEFATFCARYQLRTLWERLVDGKLLW
jgi:DNA polymerase-1